MPWVTCGYHIGQRGPRAVCLRGSPAVFYDSVPDLTPPPSYLLPFTVSPNSRDLGHHHVRKRNHQAELELGFVLSPFPFVSPSPQLAPAGRTSQRFHPAQDLERGQRRRNVRNSLGKKKPLPRGGFRAPHASASTAGPEAWGRGPEGLGSPTCLRRNQGKLPTASCALVSLVHLGLCCACWANIRTPVG